MNYKREGCQRSKGYEKSQTTKGFVEFKESKMSQKI